MNTGADHVAAVLSAEAARGAAVVARDIDALSKLLDDGLTYIHATGVRHDRAELLAFVRTGPRFLSVRWTQPQVLVQGDCAIVTGELHLRLQREAGAEPIDARSLASEVWLRNRGPSAAVWRLALFQSTRPA